MKKILGNILKWFVLSNVFIFLIANVIIYFNQDLITFFPQELNYDFDYRFDRKYEEDFFVTTSGDSLNFVVFKTKNPRQGMVFHTHGNAGNIKTSVGPYKYFLDNGYDYITWDYASFGKSSGDLEPEKFLVNAKELYEHVSKAYNDEKIILQGHSLGTSVTSYLATEYETDQVVLLAPFYNVAEMARMRFPVFDWMLSFPLKTNEFVGMAEEPFAIMHGENDETVPFEQGKNLSQVKEGIEFVAIPAFGHNNLSKTPEYKEMMDKILNRMKHE